MGTCSLYFHSSCAAGVDSRNRAEISFYARNHLPCSWHCWHFHRTKEKTHRNFLRHAASMSPEMKRMDMTGLNGSHMFLQGAHAFVNWSEPSLQKWALNEKEGYLTRHGMHFKKGIYRLILPIRWILEKAKPDPLAYSMAPSPHGVHSGRSVSLAMLILPGSSDKLGQAWTNAQLKGWKSRDTEKVSFRHDRWRMLMGIPCFSFSAEAHIHTRRPWRSENGICWSCQRCPSLITLCFERWRPSTISTATNSTC